MFVQKKTADDFVASNDEESEDEGEVGVDEEGNERKKPKVKKDRKRWVKTKSAIQLGRVVQSPIKLTQD